LSTDGACLIPDRRSDPATALAGRVLLVFGGLVFGTTQLARMTTGFASYPLYATGLGAIGVLLLAMAVFEARLLVRTAHFLFR